MTDNFEFKSSVMKTKIIVGNMTNTNLNKESVKIDEIENNEDKKVEKADSSKSIEGLTEHNFNSNNLVSPIQNNTNSNHSHVDSAPISIGREQGYLTPKSIHNLNLLFTQSNGKTFPTQSQSQSQKRIIHNTK